MDVRNLVTKRLKFGNYAYFTVDAEKYAAIADFILSKFGEKIARIEVRYADSDYDCPHYDTPDAESVRDIVVGPGDEVGFRMANLDSVCVGGRDGPPGDAGGELYCTLYMDVPEEEILRIAGEISGL